MKKSLITLVAALAVGLSAFAGTGMYVKLKNGETFRHNVDDVEEVVFAEIQEQNPLKFKVLTDSTAEVTKENCVEGSVTIPSKVVIDGKTYSVVSIADDAFNGCKGLTNITIPSSVVKIGAFAFASSGLTTIELPSSITSIDYGLFSSCSDLVSVKIPSSVESIGQSAFSNCTSLTYLELPSSVKSIGDMAFYNCTGLTNLQLSVESIGIMAFDGCENLDLVIDNSEDNVKVASKAFQNCKSVTWEIIDESESPLKFKVLTETTAEVTKESCVEGSVTIPSKVVIDGKIYSVVSIAGEAFRNCKGLTNITIPSSVVSIEDDAFYGCKGLTNITIPSSVVKIGSYAFSNSGLTTIKLPSSITSIGLGLFSGCSDLVSVKIPSSVESIGENAFVSCTSLTNLELSSSVKSIGVMAFYDCKNLDLVIDNSKDNVEVAVQAFQNCKSVTWKK